MGLQSTKFSPPAGKGEIEGLPLEIPIRLGLNPLPDPGISHGRRLGRRSRPAAAGAAPEVPWYSPMASQLRLGVNNKSS